MAPGADGASPGSAQGATSGRQGEVPWKPWEAGTCGDFGLSDGTVKNAKAHEEIKGASLTVQEDVGEDQRGPAVGSSKATVAEQWEEDDGQDVAFNDDLIGSVAMISGLTTPAGTAWNGSEGIVQSIYRARGRVGITISGYTKALSVKYSNVLVAAQDDQSNDESDSEDPNACRAKAANVNDERNGASAASEGYSSSAADVTRLMRMFEADQSP